MNEFPADITSVIWSFILIILIWFGSHLWLVLKYKWSFLLSILKIYVFPWTERLKVGMHDIVFLPISDTDIFLFFGKQHQVSPVQEF